MASEDRPLPLDSTHLDKKGGGTKQNMNIQKVQIFTAAPKKSPALFSSHCRSGSNKATSISNTNDIISNANEQRRRSAHPAAPVLRSPEWTCVRSPQSPAFPHHSQALVSAVSLVLFRRNWLGLTSVLENARGNERPCQNVSSVAAIVCVRAGASLCGRECVKCA